MKRIKLFIILAVFPSFFTLSPFSVAGQLLVVEIQSGPKVIWSAEGKINVVARHPLAKEAFEILTDQENAINREFKQYAGRGLRDAKVSIYSKVKLRVYRNAMDNKVYLQCIFTNHSLEFFITTTDKILGIGQDRKHDPYVKVFYTVVADFPIEQDNTLESIKIGKPEWKKFEVNSFYSERLEKRTDKIGTDFLKPWIENYLFYQTDYTKAFHRLDYLTDEFNGYIQSSIRKNHPLQKEFMLDENQQLTVSTDGEHKLVFKHFYTQTGMVKRTSAKDPDVILEGPKSAQQAPAPVTNSPAGVLEKNNSTKSPQINKGRVRQN